ncbi:DUF4440 domain-containing protein [Gramella jeungdoensis]|uniref:DUF4440 domain-containing protein n=1 Tax=Gramella jeungdoensis TaxID=708091 RepID=A0ABT0YYQ3_9FLAO|nr:DUF4440 domain-containing protein [Gramella jeungdoensis]MCM8568601.1 DUF4440 domain-containing protein [Gramella jeungdoensis]
MKSSAFYLALAAALVLTFSISCNDRANEPKEKEEMEAKTPKDTFNLKTAKTEIVDANTRFSELYAAKDSVGLAKLYTEDAKFMMEGSPAIMGRENIQSTMASIMNSGIEKVELRTINVWGTKDLVAEEGELTLYKKGVEVDRGKYIVLWKKVDGEWHLFRDIFNSDLSPD